MWLLDQWAERHILDAQRQGEFDDLPGSGQPLKLDDDSHVPPELRAAYRMLKNAGCLPPELEQRKEAIELSHLLTTVKEGTAAHADYARRLALLELKLRQVGASTEFLRGDYAERLMQKMKEE
ncbi:MULTISPECIES: DUF1992 domain-containing protein [Leclercia]|uniref:DnaJ family domain-containing protein n=1 Tax=Leclercia TaxID=83654 RepID=UPI000CD065F9|nr:MULTISPECIES: DUF1992 domain-containing protein [Leclercia]POV31747.1 hypothetical protein C3388_25255 [Leclercia sp. LSNIH5]POW58648.1 hypothetical protein C3389_25255 [Leclercia sp. LSNIH2]AUU82962.1 hypothetical protein C2U54_02565 [Leclercia sp. LSNIH1]MCZ7841640.1 DUF1992 domain-containing protein [Leclercia adecarboxylata]QVV61745.1 DUF1992 domain-containing protein [Leclercia sp. Colony189]